MSATASNLLPRDGEAFLVEAAIPDADGVFERLEADVAWHQETAYLMGRHVPLPRLTAWYGDAGYSYSGVAHAPRPWLPDLLETKAIAERFAGASFNAVLLNRYRSGRDSVAWHRDAEPALGPDPIVASVSLGATRRFRMRHLRLKDLKITLDLPHGSLLVMGPGSQRHWLHALPKTSRPVGLRLNLTFRHVVGGAGATGC